MEIKGLYLVLQDIILVLAVPLPFSFGLMGFMISKYYQLMLPKHGQTAGGMPYLYFDDTQPQALGGYIDFYERFTSNELFCDIDTVRTDFINTRGRQSSIWLWKGDYHMIFNDGWYTGAEIGSYTNNIADNNIFESVSWTLKRGGFILLERTVDKAFWINGFVKGQNYVASGLELTAKLVFKNETDAIRYELVARSGWREKRDGKNRYFPSNIADTSADPINGTDRSVEDVRFDVVERKGCAVYIVFQ